MVGIKKGMRASASGLNGIRGKDFTTLRHLISVPGRGGAVRAPGKGRRLAA